MLDPADGMSRPNSKLILRCIPALRNQLLTFGKSQLPDQVTPV
jgi:hypothetical protein